LVLVASVGVLAFLMFGIIPVYESIFRDFGGNLPWLTRFWLDVSDSLRTRFGWILVEIAVFIGIGVFIRGMIRRSEHASYTVERIRLYFRVSRIRYYAVVTEFSQSLAMLLGSRVPIVECLDLAAAVSRSAVLRRAVGTAARQVERGVKLHDALRAAGFFDPFYVWMIGVAEDRGELDTGALALAATYEERLDRSTRMFLRSLGPAVIVAMGFVVASVVIALYMPIFSLGDAISGN
jgi:type IV pilus assembly protein PilC